MEINVPFDPIPHHSVRAQKNIALCKRKISPLLEFKAALPQCFQSQGTCREERPWEGE